MNLLVRAFAIAVSAAITVGGILAVPANAEEFCEFGFVQDAFDEQGRIIDNVADWRCVQVLWEDDSLDDGFSKVFSISIDSDYTEQGNFNGQLTISCEKRKLYVSANVDYASGFGWSSTGQVKFDKGKASSMPFYIFRNFNGIQVKNSSTFMKGFVKAKKKVSMKINTVEGSIVAEFPKSNLLQYRAAFSNRGCKF